VIDLVMERTTARAAEVAAGAEPALKGQTT